MSYDNTDTGALFKNDKRGNEKAPDYTGTIYDASGKKRRIAAWLRQSKNGNNYMSLKIEDERSQSGTSTNNDTTQPPAASGAAGDGFDDIPF